MARRARPAGRLGRGSPTISAPDPNDDDGLTVGLAAVAGLAADVLFALTAARDIALGDSAEFVTVAATLGVAHPPGYPLLSLLGHALTWLPVGPLPFSVNLISVLASAAAADVAHGASHLQKPGGGRGRRIGAGRSSALLGMVARH